MDGSLPNALFGLKDYVPEKLLDCLGFLASQYENIIDRLSVLIANCFMAYPLSKKIFVMKTNSDEETKKLKRFISNLISYNDRRYNPAESRNIEILENYSINNFCSYKTFKEIHSLRYANIKAVFIDKNNRKINGSEYNDLINMAMHTSSNQNNKQINNIQIIFGDEFKKYINDYIYLKYSEFDITADDVFDFFRNDEDYSKIYEYKDIHILYYYHAKGDGFRFLSVKKPWDILYKEIAESYETKHNNDKNNIDIKELYQKIKTDIDFSKLYASVYLETGGSPQ